MKATELIAATKDFDSDQFLLFSNPLETLTGYNSDSVQRILAKVEEAADSGKWAIGFISYEAAPAFDESLPVNEDPDFPKICFSIFDKAEKSALPETSECFYSGPWINSMKYKDYSHALNNMKQQIMYGNSYQANYTFQLKSHFEGSSLACFKSFIDNQKTAYSTYFSFGDYSICSASPELFFERTGNQITCKPMKGTAKRVKELSLDLQNAEALRESDKEQAENIMVVDLIRNDLSIIAEDSSVKTSSIFDLEAIETVWQMTSTIHAKSDCTNAELFKALFPCASITGAPKSRTMQILKAAEKTPRRVYTGALAVYSPLQPKQIRCSVPIRTILIEHSKNLATYGTGSGITFQSDPKNEYEECLLKTKALPDCSANHQILESILFETEKGFSFLAEHLQRMKEAAEFFDFIFDQQLIEEKLKAISTKLSQKKDRDLKYKIRVLLFKSGIIETEEQLINELPSPYRLGLATKPFMAESIFVKFKTSNRKVYEENLRNDCDDTLFYNRNNEVCESSIGNFVYRIGQQWFTPPTESGILQGIYRQHLLEHSKLQEKVLTIEQLNSVEEVAIINSVRGWLKAVLTTE